MGKLDSVIEEVNKEYKEKIMSRGIVRVNTEKIKLSSPRLNYMLYGGLPRGRIIEFAGEEGGGKTTTALDTVANCQKLFIIEHKKELDKLMSAKNKTKEQESRITYLKSRGPKQCIYIDCENTLDEEWAKILGVDTNSLFIMKPMSQSAEEIFDITIKMIETDEVGLVVIDSLGVMLSKQAFEKDMKEKTYGGIAAALTLFSKKAELLCTKHNCTLIGINQMREDLNSPYGGLTTTGGKAWKHNCSLRLMFKKGNFLDDRGNEIKKSSESPAGNLVKIDIVKTKVGRPDRRLGFYTLYYKTGIDGIADLVDLCLKENVIEMRGSWFEISDIDNPGSNLTDDSGQLIKIQGRPGLIDYIKQNKWLLEYLLEIINPVIEN